MSQELIVNWLNRMSESVRTQDLDAHMDLISKKVLVYGVPNQESLDYHDWRQRRHNEFYQNLLASLSYQNLNIKTISLRRLGFQITEIMQAISGYAVHIDKEVILEQEADKQWRVVEETIKNWRHVHNQDNQQ